MLEHIELVFPGLCGTAFRVTSPQADKYNCIAWAASDTTRWWWPDPPGQPESSYWPPNVPRVETMQAFRELFAALGYSVCDYEHLEDGFEKIALFALNGVPKHAARQLPSGGWTSKLGPMEDIEHQLHDLTGMVYGAVAVVMKRPVSTG